MFLVLADILCIMHVHACYVRIICDVTPSATCSNTERVIYGKSHTRFASCVHFPVRLVRPEVATACYNGFLPPIAPEALPSEPHGNWPHP